MSLRLSTGLRNALVGGHGLPHAILVGITGDFVIGGDDTITDSDNGFVTAGFEIGDWIQIFNPTSGNNIFSVKLTGVAAGTLTFETGTVGTAEVFETDTAVVAAKGQSLQDLFKHGVIHIRAGTQPNGADDVETGIKYLEITDDGQTQVPASGLYGLEFEDDPVEGSLSKLATQTWKGQASGTGQIGWFRFYDQAVDTGGGVTSICFDGSVGLSGSQLNVASIDVVNLVDFVINSFTLIVPES
jgi:hypothetical protein